MHSTKSELRKDLKAKRLSLSYQDRRQKSAAINQQMLRVIDWSENKTIHCFEPIEELGEVNISDFPNGVQLFTSRKINNEWKIVSAEGSLLVPEQFDVIIVPMLGFDNRLHRIGYGGGYYDKFLATQPNAQKIGVCFEIGHIENVPVEPHDIALNFIVTEDKTYSS